MFVPASGVRIPLPAGARLSGWVVDGETGTGLGDARLVLDFREIARSAADGSFAFGGLEPDGEPVRARVAWRAARSTGETDTDADGSYRIAALEPGPVGFRVEVGERGLELAAELTLAAGAPGRHDFELHAQQVALTGFVRRPDGAPVAGQEVHAFSRTGRGARATTDASGAFRLWVSAVPGEALTLRARAGVVTAALFPVPAGAEGVALVLRASGHVTVRVLAPTWAPEPTELEAAWHDAVTGEAGELPRFALVPLGDGLWRLELPAGELDLELRAPRGPWEPVRLEGLRVGAQETGAPRNVSFVER